MIPPVISIVVPTFNEEACIASFIERMRGELDRLVPSWEILVVDDGSRDRTVAIVEAYARGDSRVRLVAADHRGKGAAVRRGLLEARGQWRFMADADLAMPPDNLERFLTAVRTSPAPDIVIGSREAPGAQRIGEPWWRHVVGRVFNWTVRALTLPGVQDTQCGFKLFSAEAVGKVFPRLTIEGFAFDVEVLFLAQRLGLTVREVGIVWNGRAESRVALRRGMAAFGDLLRIRWRWRNSPAFAAYALAAIFAAAISYDLLRMPIQVHDSVGELLDAQRSPSAWQSFATAFGSKAYFRPLRIGQIKATFDLAQGHYWLVYRGFHVLLLVLAVMLFTRALRVRSWSDAAAAAFALTVLTGLHTFRVTLEEAFPINHFLEMVVFCLLALNLARSRGGLVVDALALLTFTVAALILESGLLVWVVAVAAWIAGFRGISRPALVAMTVLLAVYFYARLVYFGVGSPGLTERSSGYLLSVLDPAELRERFGTRPLVFYAYNVAASAMTVLFSEPQNGVFSGVRSMIDNDISPHVVLGFVTSLTTTALIVWSAIRVLRRGVRQEAARLLFLCAAVLAANAAMSYGYTKDDIMSIGGAFYAIAACVAMQVAIAGASNASRLVRAALTVLILVTATGWALRGAGVHHTLRLHAFRVRNDWAVLPALWRKEGRFPDDERSVHLIMKLRDEALAMRTPNPMFQWRWANDLWGD